MSDMVTGLRQAIQDLLVPELKAVQVELKNHTEQISLLRQDMDKRFEAMQQSMNKRFDSVDKRFESVDKRFESVDKRFASMQEQIHELISVQKEILSKLDLDKRVTKLETVVERLEQFLKKAV